MSVKSPRKILVGTDFSAGAGRALDAALAIARPAHAEVHLVHALEIPLPMFEPYAVALPPELIGAARKTSQDKLASASERVRGAGLTGTVHLGEAPASLCVAERAKALGADLVVIGTHGHTGFKRFLLGSVAERTVKESPVSVLTVKGDGHAEAPKTIVVGVDFSPHSQEALELAADWARAFGATLHLVHGLELRMPFVTPYEVSVPDALIDAAYAEGRKRLDALAARLSGVDVRTELASAPAHAALGGVAERVRADLIVTGSRGLGGIKHAVLGSVAERTLRHAPCSVLTVKSPIG
jgi:nucleotide-binding universal stress UspA family protein